MLADSLTKLASSEIIERLLGALRGDLPEVPGKDQAVTASDATWWASLVMGAVGFSGSAQGSRNDQGGRDGDPAWSARLRVVDSKRASSASVTTTNQTETVKTVDKKKKKRRGKQRKKLTGNQREKRRHENQEIEGGPDDSEPDWDQQRPSTPQRPILFANV